MTLWLVAVIPTRRPAASRAQIIRAPVYVLPEPGGPWIGEDGLVEVQADPTGRIEVGLAGVLEVGAGRLPHPRMAAHQQVAFGPTRTGRVDAVLDDPLAEFEERGLVVGRAHPVERDERPGMGVGHRPLQVDRVLDRVDGHDRADPPVERRSRGVGLALAGVVDVAAPDIEVLGREGVAPGLATLVLGIDRLDRRQLPDRRALVDEIGRIEAHESMELPPHRLLLAPMPADELAEQPAGVLLGRALHLGADDVRIGQSCRQGQRPRLVLGDVRGQWRIARGGSRHGLTGQGRELDRGGPRASRAGAGCSRRRRGCSARCRRVAWPPDARPHRAGARSRRRRCSSRRRAG